MSTMPRKRLTAIDGAVGENLNLSHNSAVFVFKSFGDSVPLESIIQSNFHLGFNNLY